MQHTLVAVFAYRTDARNAMNELISSGFPPEEVQLSNADPTGMTDSTAGSAHSATRTGGTGAGSGASLGRVFTELFGADDSIRASRYAGAVTRGHHVLIVRAPSLPEAEHAADIVERFGPTDIDQQAWQAGAAGMGAGVPSGSARMGGAGSMQQAPPLPAQPRTGSSLSASLHLDNPGNRNFFQQHSLNQSEPTGGTYQEPLGESGLGATGSTSLHGSILRDNAAHVSSLEDIEGGPLQGRSGAGSMQRDMDPGGASPGGAGLTETRHGRSRIYSPEPASTTGGGSGLDIGSNFFGDDDDYYRNHFLANYGGEDYDRVKPAYAYGADMARHDRYRGRGWDEVEGELRRHWEARGADRARSAGSAWEKMKSAVRRGWERMTHDRDAGGDRDYRSHHRIHYDTGPSGPGMDYDSVKPAYSYGAEMRRSELYRNRPWDDVEGDLARVWDARVATGAGAGAPMEGAWDRMKAAVRHGWDRVTADDDDREYRGHWDATYRATTHMGSYDEYRPAYLYGAAMARDDRYRGREWSEVEDELRTEWENRHGRGEQSTWEEMKPAVRHGWDWVTT